MPADRLLAPLTAGAVSLANRIVMAPLTRERAHYPDDVPTELMREYYCQRADAGLIISEGTQISPSGKGYADTPGIYSAEQVAGWRHITDAVHQHGGKMAAQLWHVGRVSHSSFQPGGALPVAPSAVAFAGQIWKAGQYAQGGMVACPTPRALETAEIAGIVADFRQAAINAIEAGLKSRTQAIAERGFDAAMVDAEIAGDHRREDSLGLRFGREPVPPPSN